MDSNGYGKWWPGVDEFLGRVRGRVPGVVCHTQRWEGGIEYDVCVVDPDATGVQEEADSQRQLWACSVPFKPGQESPSPMSVEAAREQQRIADELWSRYSVEAVS